MLPHHLLTISQPYHPNSPPSNQQAKYPLVLATLRLRWEAEFLVSILATRKIPSRDSTVWNRAYGLLMRRQDFITHALTDSRVVDLCVGLDILVLG